MAAEVSLIVLGAEERLLPPISPLRDMMRLCWRDDPGDARHVTMLFASRLLGKNSVWCSRIHFHMAR
jgi:hypothetical protein